MSSIDLQSHPSALVSLLVRGKPRRWALEVTAVLVGVALVAALAKVSFFIGPVPITGQTLGVLLVGTAYGATRGASTMTAYMVAGLLGAPVFAGPTAGPASVLAPSFGFIIGFTPCAWLVGWFADRGWDRSYIKGASANAIASVIPFLVGVPYMVVILSAIGTTPSFAQAMEWGVLPFIPGGIIKAAIAGCCLPLVWSIRRRLYAANTDKDA